MNSQSQSLDSKLFFISCMFLIVFLTNAARAEDLGEAQSQVIKACLAKGANLDLCKTIQNVQDHTERVTTALVKQAGLDGHFGAALAGTAQTLATGKIRVKTSVNKVASSIELGQRDVSLQLTWNF